MPNVPLHVSARVTRRSVWTAMGMALCIGFAVASFSVVEGLAESTYAFGDALRTSALIVTTPDEAPFDTAAHPALAEGVRVLKVHATFQNGTRVTLAAFEGPGAPTVPEGQLRPGPALRVAEETQVVAPAIETLIRGAILAHPLAPATWGYVAAETARALDPRLAPHHASYVVLANWTPELQEELQAEGFVATPAPALVGFFQAGAREIGTDLALVVIFSGALVALLSYEFMRMEIRERRREIGIWRALGMRAQDVERVLLLRALLLTTAALLVGTISTLGGLLLVSKSASLELLHPRLAPTTGVAVALAFLAAGTAGAYVPARAASREDVRANLEAVP